MNDSLAMPLRQVLIKWPDKPFFPEKGPGKEDDVDFPGTEIEKILDLGPIRSVRGGWNRIKDSRLSDLSVNQAEKGERRVNRCDEDVRQFCFIEISD